MVKEKGRMPTSLQSGVEDVGGSRKRCVRQHSYSRVWMILLKGEENGAYPNIVTIGCGGYCWRVRKKVRTPT